MEKYKRLTREDVFKLSELMISCRTLTEAAALLKVDPSGLRKTILLYRELRPTSLSNKCADVLTCRKKGICPSCPRPKAECRSCKLNCNHICGGFKEAPTCRRVVKFPYCCNGCPDRHHRCKISHYAFDPDSAWEAIMRARRDPRSGVRATEDQLLEISRIVAPLVKEQRQSLGQVFMAHREELGVSYVTLLKYIDRGLVPNLANIDLTKRVKYPASYRKKKAEETNRAFLAGRAFDDFVARTADEPSTEVVEMDTVMGPREGRSCLLTLLFRRSNFMLAFKLPDKSAASVRDAFGRIRAKLGAELFAKTFPIILTDNGSEFANPLDIELDGETGEKLSSVYYCAPGRSSQKGKIEKNHVELRKKFPKGTDFDRLSQSRIDEALRHVNSTPRGILNRNAPGTIARIFVDRKVLELNDFRLIEPDKVDLSPLG